jgi:hypothetical protein
MISCRLPVVGQSDWQLTTGNWQLLFRREREGACTRMVSTTHWRQFMSKEKHNA